MLYFGVIYFTGTINPMMKAVAANTVKNIAIRSIGQCVTQCGAINNTDYSELITITKRSDETVSSISANVIKMNLIRAELTEAIVEEIAKVDSARVNIPVGSLFGSNLLSGVGFRIPIKIVPYGNALIDFESAFNAVGINQTKHEINLRVKVAMSVLLPTGSVSTDVMIDVPLVQTIIVGDVPNTYFNIDGMKSVNEVISGLTDISD